MRLEDVPKFKKLDLVELFHKSGDSETGYITYSGKNEGLGEIVKICGEVCEGKPKMPEIRFLKDYKRIVIYNRND